MIPSIVVIGATPATTLDVPERWARKDSAYVARSRWKLAFMPWRRGVAGGDARRMTKPDTATMRAIGQDTHGSPEVLKELELSKPAPGLNEILVAVRAAGVNPTDWWNRAQAISVDRLPLVLGWDVSGVVEAVGTGVTLFKPGDEVFGMLPYPGGVGSHAEYVTAPARAFATKPASIDHVQAGALPLAALTAW